MRWIILVFITIAVQPAMARMYQWEDAASGRTQLSGNPPTWYRSKTPGPRVLVYEAGELIDDTAIRKSGDQRRRLRSDAIAVINERERLAEEALLAAASKKQIQDDPNEFKELEIAKSASPFAAVEILAKALERQKEEVLKAQVQDFFNKLKLQSTDTTTASTTSQ